MWARKVFPYAQQRETEGPGHPRRPRRRRPARRSSRRAARTRRIDALRLSGQARDERARTLEAPADRRQSGRAAARPRLQRRAVHDASGAPRFALVSAAAPRGGRAVETQVELCARRTAGRLFPRRRPHVRPQGSGGPTVVRRERSSCTIAARRSPTTTAAARTPSANGRGSAGRARCEWREARSCARSDRAASVVARPARRSRVATGACASATSRASRSTRTAESRADAAALVRRAEGDGAAPAVRRAARRIRRFPRCSSTRRPTTRRASCCRRGRSIRAAFCGRSTPASEQRFRLTRLLHRGIDFERVAFEENRA